MKSILFVGAALMVGASIYGFVDYRQTQNKKEFKKMYVETPAETETVTGQADVKTIAATETKKETATAVSNPDAKTVATKNTTAKKKAAVKKKKTKRTFSTKLFSRGALEERYIKPVVKEEVKTDNKKTEEKEQ